MVRAHDAEHGGLVLRDIVVGARETLTRNPLATAQNGEGEQVLNIVIESRESDTLGNLLIVEDTANDRCTGGVVNHSIGGTGHLKLHRRSRPARSIFFWPH